MIGVYLALVLSVYDGDTFKARVPVWPGVETVTSVRVIGIDTPEIKGKCVSERAAALAAKGRLTALLASGRVEISAVKEDVYTGRVDAVVTVDGKPVADTMIAEGYARPYDGKTARAGWCP